eukprot:TRINITY_DN56976_c0_g2_i1.p1 TRINITY_DN56976_c0_g2~~TRINITY_DN56976_c0_g2_i1.p1  ORF type:complete len:705 (-),score=79.58 TRINITY_DN56976_c0_g2_i1:1898-4012(-)
MVLQMAKDLTHSIVDADELVHRIIENATGLTQADKCSLFLIDHAKQQLVVRFGKNEPEVRLPLSAGIAGHVATTGETLNIPDAYSDARFNRAVDKKTGYRTHSILCMPVKTQEHNVAVAQLINKEGNIPFNQEDEELFDMFAAFAGVCLQNAMMHKERVETMKQIEMLYETINVLKDADMRDSDEVIEKIITGAKKVVHCDRCSFFVVDKEANDLCAKFKTPDGKIQQVRVQMDQGVVGYVATSGTTLNITDAYSDPRFNKAVDKKTGYRTTTILCMPVKYKDTIVAVTQLVNKLEGLQFTENDEQILSAYCNFAGISLWNANLYKFALKAGNAAVELSNKAAGKGGTLSTSLLTIDFEQRLKDIQKITLTPEEKASVLRFDFNVHKYAENNVTMDYLIPLAVEMFSALNLIETFNIPLETLYKFIITVKNKYRDVAYHNFVHAFDVTQTLFIFITTSDVRNTLTDWELLVLLVCGLCHDIDHMGVNNSMMYTADTPLGLLSAAAGTQSALEVHHCNLAIDILSSVDTNVLSGLGVDRTKTAWRLLIDAILATDMAKHSEITAEVNNTLPLDYVKVDHRDLLIKTLLKAADISNITKPFAVSCLWGVKITREFMGVTEAPPGATDIKKADLAKNQIAFIKGAGIGMFEQLKNVVPTLDFVYEGLKANLSIWEDITAGNKELYFGDNSWEAGYVTRQNTPTSSGA